VKPVDAIMARCPLKHEIRRTLWEDYARRVAGSGYLKNYLTLYSPPLMDVKWFHEQGLLEYDGEKFVGVVGATYDSKAFSSATGQLKGRPDVLLPVDIRHLLVRPSQYAAYAKQLEQHFPFQVINLDYTNSLFHEADEEDISYHLEGLEALFARQNKHNANKFSLLLTTRTHFANKFLNDLGTRVDENIQNTPGFLKEFKTTFSCKTAAHLRKKHFDGFATVGLAKYVVQALCDHGYRIEDCDAFWLRRDAKKPIRDLLHMAFLVSRPPSPSAPSRLQEVGRRRFAYEKPVIKFVAKHRQRRIGKISESKDGKRLEQKHGDTIGRLAEINFEVPIPRPKG